MASPMLSFSILTRFRFKGNLKESVESIRQFNNGNVNYGKKNFRKFQMFNKRGSSEFRKSQRTTFHDIGIRPTGVFIRKPKVGQVFTKIPEMIPELVVPNLEGFELKPYVSYRVPDVMQSTFTSEDLFHACYAEKVVKDFEAGKLDDNGNPLEPSEAEITTAEEALIKAKQTGSDLF